MFRWFYDGHSIAWIKSQLDKEGVIACRGKLFNTCSIDVPLRDSYNIGRYTWTDKNNGGMIEPSCHAIGAETLWNEVQKGWNNSMLKKDRTIAPKGCTYFAI